MPSQRRTNPKVAAKPPIASRCLKSYGFESYERRDVTQKGTISYRESESDEDSDEVIYVGQRKKNRTKSARIQPLIQAPQLPIPKIILGDEDLTVPEKPFHNKEREPSVEIVVQQIQQVAVPVKIIANGQGRPIFQTLPLEVHQNIAKYLEEDSDVAKYARLCKQTRDSISSSVWRERFVRMFDMPDGELAPLALAKKYAYRRDIAGWICFDYKKFGGVLNREEKRIQQENNSKCLLILKDLILESNARRVIDNDGKHVVVGLNHEYMREWVTHGRKKHTDVLDAVINTEQTSWDLNDIVSALSDNSLVLVIQLCLTSVSLSRDFCNSTVSHFDMSQREAYADHRKQPVFVGGWKRYINVRWLLHTVNFFKLHLKASSGEGLLAQHYEDLESGQLPQPWIGRIKEGTQPLGSHWKSACTFMKDNQTLHRLRLDGNDDEPMIDDGELFSDMTIFFDDSKFSSSSWPTAFETLIKSNPYTTTFSPPRNRQRRAADVVNPTQYELKTFYGTSRGARLAHFFGRIHGLPEQQGIPGFQRISLIKFCPNKGEYDPCSVWTYEGCVLPGGRIIVGRWWDLTADAENPVDIFGGPFIWWNVDRSAAEPPISPEEALEFLDSIHDPSMGL